MCMEDSKRYAAAARLQNVFIIQILKGRTDTGMANHAFCSYRYTVHC